MIGRAILSLILWVGACEGVGYAGQPATDCCPAQYTSAFDYDVRLEGPLTPAEAERLERARSDMSPDAPTFGRLQSEWETLVQKIEIGDCLFQYSSSDRASGLESRRGYIVFRRGKPVASLLTFSK